MRSSSWKKGRLASLTAIPTTTWSNSAAARLTRSWWPRVMGSNVPGYTALIIDPPCQEMEMNVPCSRLLENLPARGRLDCGFAFDVDASRRVQQIAHLRQCLGMQPEVIWRIDEHDVEARACCPCKF